jgi:hypothetical protein
VADKRDKKRRSGHPGTPFCFAKDALSSGLGYALSGQRIGRLLGSLKRAALTAEQSLREHGKLIVVELARFVELDLGLHGFAAFALTLLCDVPFVMGHAMSFSCCQLLRCLSGASIVTNRHTDASPGCDSRNSFASMRESCQ